MEEFENAALFLRLSLPSTLIRHENGAFRKRSLKPEEFENSGFTSDIPNFFGYKNPN